MNFLQLCQRTVRESGTMSGDTLPTTVLAQKGRLLKVVGWVADSWNDIQTLHDTWRWMEGEFSGTTSISTPRYTAASFAITRISKWIKRKRSMTIYDTALGASDESELICITWDQWRMSYGRGAQTNGRPKHYAVSPADELCLGPIPDKTYTVKGLYVKGPQDLTDNTDVPEMPVKFHMVIVWWALLKLQESDEAVANVTAAQRNRQDLMRALERDQLPEIVIGAEALA